jgi:hypothetical protein
MSRMPKELVAVFPALLAARNFLYIASIAPYNSSVFSKSLARPLRKATAGLEAFCEPRRG